MAQARCQSAVLWCALCALGAAVGPVGADAGSVAFTEPQGIPSTYPVTLVRAVELTPFAGIRVVGLHPAQLRASVMQLDVPGGVILESSAWATGQSPKGMVLCDVDSDLLVDMLIANTSTGRMAILRQTSTGGFQLSVTSPVATGPVDVVGADIDHDGDADAALADYAASKVVILKNNGAGVFTLAQTIAVPQGPIAMTFGDFTGDGSPDLGVACSTANRAAILVNSGNGSFSLAASIPTGSLPQSICDADFDANGLSDLAVSNSNGGTVTIIRSNPGLAFDVVATVGCGAQPSSLVARDVTLDLRPDIVAANLGENSVSVLESGPDFTFTRTVLPLTFHPTAVAIADLTDDGKPDVIVGRTDVPQILVFTNAATGEVVVCPGDMNGDLYVNSMDFSVLATSFGQKLSAPSQADLNRDGRVDILDFSILASHFGEVCGDS